MIASSQGKFNVMEMFVSSCLTCNPTKWSIWLLSVSLKATVRHKDIEKGIKLQISFILTSIQLGIWQNHLKWLSL